MPSNAVHFESLCSLEFLRIHNWYTPLLVHVVKQCVRSYSLTVINKQLTGCTFKSIIAVVAQVYLKRDMQHLRKPISKSQYNYPLLSQILHLNILLYIDVNGKLTNIYDKLDDFRFPTFNFPDLCRDFPWSPTHGLMPYILSNQWITKSIEISIYVPPRMLIVNFHKCWLYAKV